MSTARRRRGRRGGGRATAAADKRNARNNFLIFLLLLLVIGFISFLTFLRQNNTDGAVEAVAAPAAAGRPKYDFYQDVQRNAVAGDDAGDDAGDTAGPAPGTPTISLRSTAPGANAGRSAPATTANPPPLPAPVPSRTAGYMVQAGAYKNWEDADRASAQLLLLGVKPHIEPGLSGAEQIHRVRIGPYPDEAQARAVQQRLQQNRIPSFVTQLK